MAISSMMTSIIDIVKKRVPDINAQTELEKELAKLDVEYTSSRGELLKSDVIRYTFPALVAIIVVGYAWNILSGAVWSIFDMTGHEKYLFEPPTELLDFLKWYCGGFFGTRVVSEYTHNKK